MSIAAQTLTRSPRFSRRAILKRAGLLTAVCLGAASYGTGFEPHLIRIRRREVFLAGLPPELDGYRVGHATDLHRGPLVGESYLAEGIQHLCAEQPDVLLLTGDFVHNRARYAESCFRALAGAGAPDGVFAVWGNHDYWSGDVEAVHEQARRAGIRVLVNESVEVRTRDVAWTLAGLDSVTAGHPDLNTTMADVGPGPRLLLAHEPDIADEASRFGVDLQLSGHSHGGQIRVPGFGAPILPPMARKYPRGLYRVPGASTQVYTSAGMGVIFPPIRINCPPEMAILTLRRGLA